MFHCFCFEESITLGKQLNIIFFFRLLEATVVLPTEIGTFLLWGEVPSTYGFSSFTYTTAYNFCHTDIEQCIGSVCLVRNLMKFLYLGRVSPNI